MDFKQLQSFVEVIRTSSFTKAAENLYISQPTISLHIRQLEEELGTRLITRTTKSFNLTPLGHDFFTYAVDILTLKERMIQSCSAGGRQIISLGASTIPSAYILPEILPAFGKKSPNTYFVIHQSDSKEIQASVKTGIYDIGLIGMNPEDDQLEAIPFCQDRMIVITPINQHFLDLQAASPTIADLLCEPIIMREHGSGSQKRASEYLEHVGVSENNLNIIARINDQEAIKNMVAGGLGISIISERAAHNFLEAKRLLAFDILNQEASRYLYAIYRKDYVIQPVLRDFIAFLRKSY